MADNVAITPGAGVTVATDDVGGVQYQRVKLVHGADGSATDASAAAGLPVDIVSSSGTMSVNDANRVNTNNVYLASLARTATPTKLQNTNKYAAGVIVVVNVTAISSASVSTRLKGYDPVDSTTEYFLTDVPTAITATGVYTFALYPAATSQTGTSTVSDGILPRLWTVDLSHADGNSITYSVGYSYILTA